MKSSRLMYVPISAMAVAFAWSSLVAEPQRNGTPYPLPASQVAARSWQVDAGQVFGLPPGQVERAMTERDWQKHQRTMAAMRPVQRARYQQDVRARLLKQAQG